VQGAEPLFFLDYLAVNKLDPRLCTDMVKGVAEGCVLAGCALLGGETAEMPDVYHPGDFDMAGFAVGVCELKGIIDGKKAKPGDVILGLSSSGIHSNGYSLVRAIVKAKKLKLDKVYPQLDPTRTLGQVLLEPTKIYAKAVMALLDHFGKKTAVTCMAHITGSGLPGNVPRTFGTHLNARLDKKAWQPLPVFSFLQKQGNVTEQEMFNVFNMGIGYTITVRKTAVNDAIKVLAKAGEKATVIGKLVKGERRSGVGLRRWRYPNTPRRAL
jgi:phosphoribosylformylglycinamidine cyclo-ligase